MPELPELEVLKENLLSKIKGKEIEQLRILKPYILKSYFRNDLFGEKIKDVTRKGKFILLVLKSHTLVVHLMLHGSVKYVLPLRKPKKSAAALIIFKDDTFLEMSESSSKKRMSLYVLNSNELLKQIENLGVDPLGRYFSRSRLRDLLYSEPRQLKSFLRKQSKIAGIGNAYADEILWQAQLSPFKITTHLEDKEIERFYNAITNVLENAIAIIRDQAISEKREFLKIHGKQGKLCPRCGASIERVSFSRTETFYCPRCQTKGRKLKDRRMSQFYR